MIGTGDIKGCLAGKILRIDLSNRSYKGFKINEDKYNEMLDEFYELSGWDKETGMQTRSDLEKLGLKDIAKKLAKQDKLADK